MYVWMVFRSCVGRVCDNCGYEVSGMHGSQERVVVGNLATAMVKLHTDLSSGTVEFGREISRLQKEAIRREARLKGYAVVEDETGLKVSRMSILVPESEAKRRSIQELSQLSGQVFQRYATGMSGTAPAYMRRNDLLDMVKDGGQELSDAQTEGLKKAYDETLHLQIEVTKACFVSLASPFCAPVCRFNVFVAEALRWCQSVALAPIFGFTDAAPM
ncbi:hypothetical protein AK812_SmicGene38 [Symbiodinium microadriaticum]|uniref:Uncharacterized protein n=1 Tax=Symbiodinium microadriaticum TaxID=2951 RepID=A0A1Q9F7S0_SYMMI|nr:hypothetical protein AK812_SmicGene38 [Symbiodinium microadriaticum]